MKKFVVHSEFEPSGDQPQAIEKLSEGFLRGDRYQTLKGVTGSGKTLLARAVAGEANVPFYSIALHGYKNYSGPATNLSWEGDQVILESAENGAALYYVFMNAKEDALQESRYTEYFAANFDSWKDRFNEICTEYNKNMKPVMNSLISNHEYLSEQVTQTTYDNGYKVIVNFGYVDFTAPNGSVIPARSYKVLK